MPPKGKGGGAAAAAEGKGGQAKGGSGSNTALEDKAYLASLQEVFKSTALRPSDCDPKVVQLLDALQEAGRIQEACAYLSKNLEGSTRDRVSNWRRYAFKLLRTFDPEVYNHLHDMRGFKRPPRDKTGERLRVPFTPLRAEAAEFVPGKPWTPATETPEKAEVKTEPQNTAAAPPSEAKADESAPNPPAETAEVKS
mmetsp:Transcript_1720/g.4029  ORF Transcript_1720/g.4029 Transcript_1720/m.4029 type:complete len:196 (-) Transcript_1720:199-786(-)